MHPALFLLQLIRDRSQIDPTTFEAAMVDLKARFDNSTGKIGTFLRSPYVLVVLGFFYPMIKKGFDGLLNRWIGDQDGDGDADLNDLILRLASKQLAKKGIELPAHLFEHE